MLEARKFQGHWKPGEKLVVAVPAFRGLLTPAIAIDLIPDMARRDFCLDSRFLFVVAKDGVVVN